jgi:hypothetical protein
MDSPDARPLAVHKTPRWVRVFALAGVAALVVALLLMHALGGGMGGH